MSKYIAPSFMLRWSFAAFTLAAPTLHGQNIPYPPGNFDISITLGCDCSCCCDTNNPATNNPIGLFLSANPITGVSASGAVALPGQVVPPHWTEFLGSCIAPYDAVGTIHNFLPEGWTETVSGIPATTSTWQNNSVVLPSNFSLCRAIDFKLPFEFYADVLPPFGGSPGDLPVPTPPAGQSSCQPYPWDVNATMYLLNGQVYNMEQQLVVPYFPLEDYPPPLETPVDYVETNGLLLITLVCTNDSPIPNGTPIQIYTATIVATLDNVNIPPPLNEAQGWVFSPDLFTNWAWPLTLADAAEPSSPYNTLGAAGTVQASLNVSGPIVNTGLLVRANRSYTLTIENIVMLATYNGNNYPVSLPPLTIDTGLVPPCTSTNITIYTTNCSVTYTPGPQPPICQDTGIAGNVNMLGPPAPTTSINVNAFAGPYNNWKSLTPPLAAPGSFLIFPMVGSDAFGLGCPGHPYEVQATIDLGSFSSYEFFASPILSPVYAECGYTNNLTNVFVMCPTNPGIVQGTVSLCGPVDTNYYGGYPALKALQFATYDTHGLPLDPITGTPSDPTLQNNPSFLPFTVNYNSSSGEYLSYIQATGGATATGATPLPTEFPPPCGPLFQLVSLGGGSATTEFDSPGNFYPNPNSYVGNYSLKMAGLQGQASYWSPDDLHLVFGPPVNLTYDVIETGAPYANFSNVVITCGTSLTNNISICFGLATIVVSNQYPQAQTYVSVSLQVTGSGPGYTVGPLTLNNFPYQNQTTTLNTADVPLFLPAGTYQSIGTVFDATGLINLKVTNYFTVTCACSTNVAMCCTNCAPPYPDSYTVTVYPGFNFLADDLCQGTNNTVAALLPNVPDGTLLYTWNYASQSYNPVLTYSTGSGWDDPTVTLAPGEGFILNNPASTNFTLTISGCMPDCPLPCTPTNGFSLIGAYGTGTATWSNLFSCPPVCGTEVLIYTPGSTGGYTTYTYGIGGWVPFPPVLAVGQSAWVYVNPNPGLTVVCPRNKTVQCGTNWTFDLPAGTSCCASNVNVTLTGTVTNGGCPQLVTRTWLLTDACGEAETCSQTVTVINTNLPMLVCASNIMVSSDQPWSFTPPTATTPCCTNATITIVGTVTTVSTNPCAINYTRTWQVTDCCTNTATCSQTVTVIPTGSCQVFNTGMNGTSALPTGALDPNFVLVSVPTWAGTSALVINPSYANGAFVGLFDGPNSQWIGPDTTLADEPLGVYHYRLQFLLCCTNGAELHGRMAADSIAKVYLNTHFVASIPGYTTWTPISVASGFVGAPLLNTLDIYVTNNYTTGFPGATYPATAFRAEVTNCISQLFVACATNKTVGCCSNWTFDPPRASSCCGSNVTTTVVSTVTNGAGHVIFTGGGSAANGEVVFAGNTATSGFLEITGGTNMGTYTLSPGSGTNAGFVWDNQIFPASDPFIDVAGLLFTNSDFELNLFGNGPGSYSLVGAPTNLAYAAPLVTNGVASLAVCSQTITRTWLFTDGCGNSNTCSQTVTVTSTPPVIVCSTNKTIPCTSNVVFDLPTVVPACCCTNYSISTFGSDMTTNTGSDTYAITRTWLITDCCGNSNFCSQTVTVQDTTLYTWTTLAGLAGSSGTNDGTGSAARFFYPYGVGVDSAGNIYVGDADNYTIRKVTLAGVVTTLAGLAGSFGSADGTGSAARFSFPSGVAVDSAGNIYVADTVKSTIRKVTPGGVVTTFAGLAGSLGSSDGTGSAARFNQPQGVAVDSTGNVYVGDSVNYTIRKITPGGVVTTLAGLAGNVGSADGTGNAARFYYPQGVAVDSAGNIYVADKNNQTIRKVTSGGVVTTLAGLAGSVGSADGTGSAARFNYPEDVGVDSAGSIYVADQGNSTIRKVTSAGVVTTLGGLAGNPGSADGTGSTARFGGPSGVVVDSAGNIYVADQNHTIRKGAPTPCPTNPCPPVTTITLNTGFDQTAGTLYPIGAADAFWWVTADPTVPATTLPRPATVIQANPAWQPAQANSQWISSYPTEADNLNGEYDFETFFCVTTNATNLVLNVCLRADDQAGAYLNGNQIPLAPPNTTWGAPVPACGTVINPSWFVPGLNVLLVRVTNVYAVAMGLNAEASVTGSGLIAASAPCCHPNSGISGQKFYDLNNNGVHDAGEPALSGWTIHLSNGATAVTDVNGYYYFLGLVSGIYTVTETVQSGWTQTAPAGGSYTVTLGAAQQINGQDFGNYRTNNPNCVHIACPSNIVAQCTGSGAVVAFNVTATSTCTTNPVKIYCTPPSTTLFPVGTTVVHVTAEDSLYDWATNCSFTVTVVDTTPPVITCPSNIVIVTCSTNVPVTWSIMATDMCSSVTVTSSPPSGTIFHRDTTNTVIAVATDGSGNTNTCSFLVIVRKPTLNISTISGSGFPVTVTITWVDGGILQQADSVLGPWTDLPLATSPYTVVASGSQKFYRLRCP